MSIFFDGNESKVDEGEFIVVYQEAKVPADPASVHGGSSEALERRRGRGLQSERRREQKRLLRGTPWLSIPFQLFTVWSRQNNAR